MGAMTFGDIITEGLLVGGDTSLVTRAPVALKNWLRKEAAAWPWPHLIKTTSGIALSANSAATIGNGVGGVTDVIHQIRKPVTLYTSDFKTRVRPNIVQYDETDKGLSTAIYTGLSQVGPPAAVKIGKVFGTRGQWTMNFFPRPDVAYLMELILWVIPADPANSDYPWYPEDETMIEFVRAFVKKFKDGDTGGDIMDVVSDKVVADRARHGGVPGFNEDLSLDPEVFR